MARSSPSLGVSSTISPPCERVTERAMARLRPPVSRLREASSPTNGSKTRPISAVSIPGPSSSNTMRTAVASASIETLARSSYATDRANPAGGRHDPATDETEGVAGIGEFQRDALRKRGDKEMSVERERVAMFCHPLLRSWGLRVRASVRYSPLL